MAFKFAARALLELGKELISSDEVALYELIKNGVDAGSSTINLEVRVVVPHSAYVSALDAIDAGVGKKALINKLRASVDMSASTEAVEEFFSEIGKAHDSIRSLRKALVELYEQFNWIEIVDEGHGMSLKELSDVYLTVGTRSRRAENVKGAQFLGDKGVGRLSAMRLGNRLHVETTRMGEDSYSNLDIDWTQFSHDSTKDASEIPVAPREGKRKSNKRLHGTTIRISELTADWTQERFHELLVGKIARMVDPFEKGRANRLIAPRYNGRHLLIPSIPDALLKTAHANCYAKFDFNRKGEPVLTAKMTYRLRSASRDVHQQGAEVLSIAQRVLTKRGKRGHAASTAVPIRLKALKDLGPFEVEVYWYNRLVVEAMAGLTERQSESRRVIAQWSGGPMLFRRGFRILPYGEPGDDWLELDKNAFGVAGFKLNRQQVIGRVRVTAGHAALSEQTNREGLVQSDARDALRIILMWLLHTEFRGLINDADAAHELRERKNQLEKIDLGKENKSINDAFADLTRVAGPEARPQIERLHGLFEKLSDTCHTIIEASAAQSLSAKLDREKFVHLAGIGLMTEFIFHELDRVVAHTLRLLLDRKQSKQVNLEALEEQLVTLQKRVSAFDEFTGERRQSKSNFDAREPVRLVLENHTNQLERHGIKVVLKANQPFKVRAVRGMLIQIIENLVVNAIYWLKAQKRIESNFKPELIVSVDAIAKSITVTDNGPGVDPSRKELIFQPFVTSKPPGEGRGLGLYISRELADYHGWQLEMDGATDAYREGRLNSFVLDLDEAK